MLHESRSDGMRKYGDSVLEAMLDVAQDEAVSEDFGVDVTCMTSGLFGRRGGSGVAASTGLLSIMESHLALVVALLGETGGGLEASSGMWTSCGAPGLWGIETLLAAAA